MRTVRVIRLLTVLALGAVISLLGEPSAHAKSGDGFVNVIEIGGYIDPVVRDFVLDSVDAAVNDGAEALVIQLDSPGSLLSSKQQAEFVDRLRADHRVPIAAWIGGGASPRAKGGAVDVFDAADIRGMARLAKLGNPNGPTFNFNTAQAAKRFELDAPVLAEFVGLLDGKVLEGKTISTAEKATTDAKGRANRKLRGVRFAKLSLLPRLVHMAASPSIAYFLFTIALALFVFEFFTGGIGIAATVGLMMFVLGVAGLGALPTRPVGIALLLLAMLGFAIDIQSGTPRFWTAVGAVSFVVGSLVLFASPVHVPWFIVAVLTVMVLLFMVNGMPTMVRTRFATPTVGREGMIGEVGSAIDEIAPEGVVTVMGAPWRARTNRATPIGAGAPVRVVAIDGLLLEVEPLEGGARDAGH